MLSPLAVCANCTANSFITTRQSDSFKYPIKYLEEVTKVESKFCDAEWSAHGSCCEIKSTMKNIYEDLDNLNQAVTRLITLYNAFKRSTTLLMDTFCDLAVSEPEHEDGKKRVEAAKRFLENEENINALDLNYEGDFAKDSETCWKKIGLMRKNSVCSICSGRSEVFFQGEKGIAEEKVCGETLAVCYKVLKITGRLVKLTHWMLTKNDELSEAGVYPVQGDGEPLGRVSSWKAVNSNRYRPSGSFSNPSNFRSSSSSTISSKTPFKLTTLSTKNASSRNLFFLSRLREIREIREGAQTQKDEDDKDKKDQKAEDDLKTLTSTVGKYYREFISDGLALQLQKLDNDHEVNNPILNMKICHKFLNIAERPFIDPFTDALSLSVFSSSSSNLIKVHIDAEVKKIIRANKVENLRQLRESMKMELHSKLLIWRGILKGHKLHNRRHRWLMSSSTSEESSSIEKQLESTFNTKLMSSDIVYFEEIKSNMNIDSESFISSLTAPKQSMNFSLASF